MRFIKRKNKRVKYIATLALLRAKRMGIYARYYALKLYTNVYYSLKHTMMRISIAVRKRL